MQGIWWKLPLLRGLSPMGRGIVEAVGVVVAASAGAAAFVIQLGATAGESLLRDIAQIGATLLVAYAIESSWLLKASPTRSRNRENWVGFTTGVGLCGFLGIFLAFVLSAIDDAPIWLQEMSLSGVIASIGLVGLVVAILPALAYEWAHIVRSEPPDE